MIILDNTALSAFAHIDRLDIPSKLFGETFIPESVYYEGVLKAKKSERVDRIKKCVEEGLIKVIKHAKDDVEFAKKLPATLGLGERYTIAIGISKGCLIATDDLKPRKIAKGLGLDIIGTLGILRMAHKRNLIDKDELGQLVEMLREILFFTDDLEKWVLFLTKYCIFLSGSALPQLMLSTVLNLCLPENKPASCTRLSPSIAHLPLPCVKTPPSLCIKAKGWDEQKQEWVFKEFMSPEFTYEGVMGGTIAADGSRQ